MATITNDLTQPGDIFQYNVRLWSFAEPGISGIGTASNYGAGTETRQMAIANYVGGQRPYRDGDPGTPADGLLQPPAEVEDGNDNGVIDNGEDSPNVGIEGELDGDVYLLPEVFTQQLTAVDIDNDGAVELPQTTNLAEVAGGVTGLEASQEQVIKHIATHELCHAVGCRSVHTKDDEDLQYEATNNWRRDDHIGTQNTRGGTATSKEIIIHNLADQLLAPEAPQ